MTNRSSKNKILVFIIFLLLLTNIAVVGYFLFFCKKKPPKNKSKDSFTTVLQKELGFNQQQIDQFNKIKKTHWEQAKAKMDEIIKLKNVIFDHTRQPGTPDSVIEKLADSIGNLQKKVEIDAYHHVLETREICTPAQQAAYDSLMKRIINRGRMGRTGGASPLSSGVKH